MLFGWGLHQLALMRRQMFGVPGGMPEDELKFWLKAKFLTKGA